MIKFRDVKESIGGGRTQTGKTALKAAMAIIARLCRVLVVVVTTTLANRDKICDDLNSPRYFRQLETTKPICTTITRRELSASEHEQVLDECIQKGGVIVVNLTASSVKKVRKLIQQARGVGSVGWTLIKDEGDTFDRSREACITVNMTLTWSFAGSMSHSSEQQLKSDIAGSVWGKEKAHRRAKRVELGVEVCCISHANYEPTRAFFMLILIQNAGQHDRSGCHVQILAASRKDQGKARDNEPTTDQWYYFICKTC